MTKTVKPVSEKYFGMNISNSQDPDEPYDPVQAKKNTFSDSHMNGRGSQGGGSKKGITSRRSGALSSSSKPKSAQRLRG